MIADNLTPNPSEGDYVGLDTRLKFVIFYLMNKKVEAGKPLCTQPNITLAQLMKQFSDETACKTLLRDMRWPDGVKCPRCGKSERSIRA